jgi:hypothetical protein
MLPPSSRLLSLSLLSLSLLALSLLSLSLLLLSLLSLILPSLGLLSLSLLSLKANAHNTAKIDASYVQKKILPWVEFLLLSISKIR